MHNHCLTQSLMIRNPGEFSSGFWLRVSHELAVKLSAGASGISKLDCSWDLLPSSQSYWQASVPHILLAGGLSSSLYGLLHRLSTLTTWQLDSPRAGDQERATKTEAVGFSNLPSKVTYCHILVCLHTDQPGTMWDGTLHEDVNTRKQGEPSWRLITTTRLTRTERCV